MTRGQCGSLHLHRKGLPPSAPCRSPGALRPSIEQLLLAAGYTVDGAGTFAGASALLALSAYDLVITDAMLEDGNGIDIANAAKSRGIKALVLTGYAAQFPLELLEQHPCLGKPVRGEELLRVVAQYLAIDTS